MSPLTQPRGRWSLGRGGVVLLVVLAAVLAAGFAIAATTGGRPPPPAPERLVGAPAPGPLADARHAPDPAAVSAARTFLTGYLAYRYGQANAHRIRDASSGLIAVLAQGPPAVAPAVRRLHPTILQLGAHEAGGNLLHITALISDGLARYPVRIVMVHDPGGWETTQLSNPE